MVENSNVGIAMPEIGRTVIVLVCGTLVYYHCAYRHASLVSLLSDVLVVLLCSLAILGLLFRQINISLPVDPLEWQISQDAANSIVAGLANTLGAAESVLRVAATGMTRGGLFSLHAVSLGASSFRSYSCLCWIMLVLSLHVGGKLSVNQRTSVSVPGEKQWPFCKCRR